MRVLSVFSRRITGPAIALINVMKGLSDLGIVVDVLGSPDAPYAHFFTELAEHNVKIHKEPFVWNRPSKKLKELAEEADVIHVHDGRSGYALGHLKKGKPMVLTLEGDPYFELRYEHAPFYKKLLAKRLWRYTFLKSDFVVPCSRWLATQVEEKYGLQGRVKPIHNPCDVEKFRRLKHDWSSRVVLSVGRTDYVKAPEILEQAAPNVLKQEPKASFLWIGDNTQRKNLYVKYMPFQSEVQAFYEKAQVFAITSRYEPFGNVAVEAQASGLPVVASKTGGLAENVLDEKTGLLVEPENPYALAEALLALLRDEKRCHRYGEAGRKWAENFSPYKVASQYLEVYEAVAKR